MTVLDAPRRKNRRERERFFTDVPFTKAPSTGAGNLILTGYANTWGLDRDGEMVSRTAFDKSLPEYLSKNPMVLWQHKLEWPIGRVSTGSLDENGLHVTAEIPNPGPDAADWQKGAYTSIKQGIVRTFSIGGYMYREVQAGPEGPIFIIAEVELFEISCVSVPANADSIYEAALKALSGESGTRLTEKATNQMEQLLGFSTMTDPELLGMGEDARGERYDALSALFRDAHDVDPPSLDAYTKIVEARDAGISPLKIAAATSMVAKAFYTPVSEEKAGRAISSTNRTKLEAALSSHDDLEASMIDCAESLKAAAASHGEAVSTIKDVLGVAEEPDDEDVDAEEDEAGGSPEKATEPADEKMLASEVYQELRDAGVERLGGQGIYVFVDDYDLDEGYVVYCVYTVGTAGQETSGDQFMRVAILRGADGTIALGDEVVEVSIETSYVPKALGEFEPATLAPAAKAAAEDPDDDVEVEDVQPTDAGPEEKE